MTTRPAGGRAAVAGAASTGCSASYPGNGACLGERVARSPERPGVCKFEIAKTLRYTKLSRPSRAHAASSKTPCAPPEQRWCGAKSPTVVRECFVLRHPARTSFLQWRVARSSRAAAREHAQARAGRLRSRDRRRLRVADHRSRPADEGRGPRRRGAGGRPTPLPGLATRAWTPWFIVGGASRRA